MSPTCPAQPKPRQDAKNEDFDDKKSKKQTGRDENGKRKFVMSVEPAVPELPTERGGVKVAIERYVLRDRRLGGARREFPGFPMAALSDQFQPRRRDARHAQVRETAPAYPTAVRRQTLDVAVLDEIVCRIVEVAQPDRIVLFGSAARGEMGSDSDVDLLVIKSGVEHRRRLAQEIYMNLSGVGISVDVVVATPQDIDRFRYRVGSILRPALREGREIYVP